MIIFVLISLLYVFTNALFNSYVIKWQKSSIEIQRRINSVGFAPNILLDDNNRFHSNWHKVQSYQIGIVGILIVYLFTWLNVDLSWTTLFHGALLAGIFHSFRFCFFDPILNLFMDWYIFYTGGSGMNGKLRRFNFPLKIFILLITAWAIWYLATIYSI